jgi:SP family general alpha glucoside:H+ symporter-like MFS transporter
VALRELNAVNPFSFRPAIYTQWGMIGIMVVLYIWAPESPWWLVSKGKLDQARKILQRHFGHIEGYDIQAELEIMVATIEEEKRAAQRTNELGEWAIFKRTNLWRLLIASWPKVTQQFVGLTVFNTYSTYFCKLPGLSAVLYD